LTLQILAFTLILVFVSVVGIAWQRRPPMVRRRCLVTLISDDRHALSGVLWRAHGPWLVFRDCAMTNGQTRTPMSGEVVVDRRNVALVQVDLPHGGEQLR